ncbi:unnamed protein product [Coregonus sp. 'balchen']|nr:unnamed protein product [Coregonus sp. 'balchen']
MNPADSATLHQTLVGQGALLEQHHQALKTLLEHTKEFSQSLPARSDSGPCLQSHVSSSCYSVLDSPLYCSL